MHYLSLIFLLYSILCLAGCGPLAAAGVVASTISRSVENENKPIHGSEESPGERAHNVAVANLNLGLAYMKQGKYERALVKLNRAKAAKRDYAPIYNAFGLLYQRMGENEIAEKNFRHAIDLKPNDSPSLNNYGFFLCQNRRFKEAEEYFMKAAQNPLYQTPELAITNAGTCALANDRLDVAENYFRQALNRNPIIAPALIQMAELSYDQGNYSPAHDYLDRYLKIGSHTSKSLWLGIRIETELGDMDAVSSYALLLRNKFPDSEEAGLLIESGDDYEFRIQ